MKTNLNRFQLGTLSAITFSKHSYKMRKPWEGKIMKKTIMVMLLSLVAGFASAQSQERVVLEFDDVHLKGSSVLKLKQEIKSQYGINNLKSYKISSVKLVAKTKNGKGKAALIVGNKETSPKVIAGAPKKFNRDGAKSFDRVTFKSPSSKSTGAWRIELQGNFKVRKAVVILNKCKRKNCAVKPDKPVKRSYRITFGYTHKQFNGCVSCGGSSPEYAGRVPYCVRNQNHWGANSCKAGYSKVSCSQSLGRHRPGSCGGPGNPKRAGETDVTVTCKCI